MAFSASLATISTVFLVNIATVFSYQDLRVKPCKNRGAYETIPPERADWSGSITLTIECDKNYDFALNAPENSVLTCLPDGSSWKPDYLPDCNEKIVPTTVKLTMKGRLAKSTCSALGILTNNIDGFRFTSGLLINTTEKCERSQIHNCILKQATINCSGITENDGSGDKGGIKFNSYISVELHVALSTTISWSKYRDACYKTAVSILRDIDPGSSPSNIIFSLQPQCMEGTVAVLRAGVEVVCRGCSLGHFLDPVEKKCLPCKPGYYGDLPLQISCKLCPGVSMNLKGSVWQQINNVAPNRVHDVEGCPVIHQYQNGTVGVALYSNLHWDQIVQKDNPWIRKDPEKEDGGFMGMIIGVIIICTTLAALYIGASIMQDVKRDDSRVRQTFENMKPARRVKSPDQTSTL